MDGGLSCQRTDRGLVFRHYCESVTVVSRSPRLTHSGLDWCRSRWGFQNNFIPSVPCSPATPGPILLVCSKHQKRTSWPDRDSGAVGRGEVVALVRNNHDPALSLWREFDSTADIDESSVLACLASHESYSPAVQERRTTGQSKAIQSPPLGVRSS